MAMVQPNGKLYGCPESLLLKDETNH